MVQRSALRVVGDNVELTLPVPEDEQTIRSWPPHRFTPEGLLPQKSKRISMFVHRPVHPNDLILVIRRQSGAEPIGVVRFSQVSFRWRAAELRFAIGDPAWRGFGYGRDAVAAAVRFAFDALGLKRIHARVHEENTASIRLLESLGFHVTKRKKNHYLIPTPPEEQPGEPKQFRAEGVKLITKTYDQLIYEKEATTHS